MSLDFTLRHFIPTTSVQSLSDEDKKELKINTHQLTFPNSNSMELNNSLNLSSYKEYEYDNLRIFHYLKSLEEKTGQKFLFTKKISQHNGSKTLKTLFELFLKEKQITNPFTTKEMDLLFGQKNGYYQNNGFDYIALMHLQNTSVFGVEYFSEELGIKQEQLEEFTLQFSNYLTPEILKKANIQSENKLDIMHELLSAKLYTVEFTNRYNQDTYQALQDYLKYQETSDNVELTNVIKQRLFILKEIQDLFEKITIYEKYNLLKLICEFSEFAYTFTSQHKEIYTKGIFPNKFDSNIEYLTFPNALTQVDNYLNLEEDYSFDLQLFTLIEYSFHNPETYEFIQTMNSEHNFMFIETEEVICLYEKEVDYQKHGVQEDFYAKHYDYYNRYELDKVDFLMSIFSQEEFEEKIKPYVLPETPMSNWNLNNLEYSIVTVD